MPEKEITVDRLILRRIRIPMREPFRISNGVVYEKESIVIELHSGNDVGYGEASPMSGSFYSPETPESTWEALCNNLVTDLLASTTLSPISYAEFLDEDKKEPFARAGIEGAVWDLFARKSGTSLKELLGAPQGKISSGLAVGIYDSIPELLDRIECYLRDGYQRVKIKIAPGWDLDPIIEIRARFGDIPLMADANAAYNFDEHFDLLASLDAFDLMMIEQPFAADALAEMAELSQIMQTPICLDESAHSMSGLEDIITLKTGSIINIKVQRVGGLWNARKMLERARNAGLKCWLGTMPELGIASAQALAIATLPGFVYSTDIEASERWFIDDIIDPLITIDRNGFIINPEHGYTVNMEKLERYTVERKQFKR